MTNNSDILENDILAFDPICFNLDKKVFKIPTLKTEENNGSPANIRV